MPTFAEQLSIMRSELEQKFDQALPKLFDREIELLNDLVFSCSENMQQRQPNAAPARLACLGLAVQCLWGAMNLARMGLYSPAQALLRCAFEHSLRWELANRQHPVGQTHVPSESHPRAVDRLEPRELRSATEPDPWFHEGLCAVYDLLTGDVHLQTGPESTEEAALDPALWDVSRFFKIMTVSKLDAKGRPECLSANLFGSHDLPDPSATPLGFYRVWTRLCCRLVTSNIDDRLIAEHIYDVYPEPTREAVSVTPRTVAEVCVHMWSEGDRDTTGASIWWLDVCNGSVAEQRYDSDDSGSILAQHLPICSRDPLIRVYRHAGSVPLPRCTLRLKWRIAEDFANQKLRTDGYRSFIETTRSQIQRQRGRTVGLREGCLFRKLENYLASTFRPDWTQYRDQHVFALVRHYGLLLGPSDTAPR